jgi:hypothetical protein
VIVLLAIEEGEETSTESDFLVTLNSFFNTFNGLSGVVELKLVKTSWHFDTSLGLERFISVYRLPHLVYEAIVDLDLKKEFSVLDRSWG